MTTDSSPGAAGAPVDGAADRRPLHGIRILAIEQMQAVPFATQLMRHLGAEVVKIEHPTQGDSGRGSQPAVTDSDGRLVGATYLRNNLGKRSVGIDLKKPEGRDLIRRLVPRFDVVVENFKSGTLERLGLGYDDLAALRPGLVYASVSGFGNLTESPYSAWPAYAPIVEAMSGIYEYRREGETPPMMAPVGALGDTASGLFMIIGVLSALRRRDVTGEGGRVDISMYDVMVSMADVVPNFHSLGMATGAGATAAGIMSGFRARDGWFVVQAVREHQIEKFCEAIGHTEWLDDPRFQQRSDWNKHLEDVVRPAVDEWARDKSKHEAAAIIAAAGIAAGPSNTAEDLLADPHVRDHHMIVEMARPDGGQPVLTSGNPVKIAGMPERDMGRWPVLGEHTDEVLRAELALSDATLAHLRESGAISAPVTAPA
jgi:crotonobetainyl-CoA:carnitine CoA-transferase CaiB-like acyl-CoA transferase